MLRPTKSDTFLVLSLYLSLLSLSLSLSLLFLSLSGCWSICMQLSSIRKKKVPYVWHCSVPTLKNIYLFNGQGDIRIKENSTIRIRITNIWIPGSSFNVLLLIVGGCEWCKQPLLIKITKGILYLSFCIFSPGIL